MAGGVEAVGCLARVTACFTQLRTLCCGGGNGPSLNVRVANCFANMCQNWNCGCCGTTTITATNNTGSANATTSEDTHVLPEPPKEKKEGDDDLALVVVSQPGMSSSTSTAAKAGDVAANTLKADV